MNVHISHCMFVQAKILSEAKNLCSNGQIHAAKQSYLEQWSTLTLCRSNQPTFWCHGLFVPLHSNCILSTRLPMKHFRCYLPSPLNQKITRFFILCCYLDEWTIYLLRSLEGAMNFSVRKYCHLSWEKRKLQTTWVHQHDFVLFFSVSFSSCYFFHWRHDPLSIILLLSINHVILQCWRGGVGFSGWEDCIGEHTWCKAWCCIPAEATRGICSFNLIVVSHTDDPLSEVGTSSFLMNDTGRMRNRFNPSQNWYWFFWSLFPLFF